VFECSHVTPIVLDMEFKRIGGQNDLVKEWKGKQELSKKAHVLHFNETTHFYPLLIRSAYILFYFLLDYCFKVFSVEYAMCLKESTYFVF
jgi:hypothetical protein